jgi:hypothetical protein
MSYHQHYQSRDSEVFVGRRHDGSFYCSVCEFSADSANRFEDHTRSEGHGRRMYMLEQQQQRNGHSGSRSSAGLLRPNNDVVMGNNNRPSRSGPAGPAAGGGMMSRGDGGGGSYLDCVVVHPLGFRYGCNRQPGMNGDCGEYVCELCDLTVYSREALQSHVEGARHEKQLRIREQQPAPVMRPGPGAADARMIMMGGYNAPAMPVPMMMMPAAAAAPGGQPMNYSNLVGTMLDQAVNSNPHVEFSNDGG